MRVIDHVTPERAITDDAPAISGRVWLAHSVSLLALLIGLSWSLGPGLFTIDENAYQTQADQLTDVGHWAIPLIPSQAGVDVSYAPLALSQVQGDVWYPYARHAAYPAAIAVADTVVPANGAAVLSIVSLVVLALAGGLAVDRCRRTGPSRVDARLVFWLTASVSPFLVHSQIGWAHLPAAAAFVCAFGVIQTAPHWSASRAVAVFVGIAISVLLRTEALLASLALIVSVAVHPFPHSDRFRWMSTTAGAAGAAFVLDRVFFRLVTGSVSLAPTGIAAAPGSVVTQRMQATIAFFLDVGGQSPQHIARLLAAILLIAAAIVVRRGGDAGMVTVLSALALGAGVFGALNGDSYGGLLAAWPALVPAMVFVGAVPRHRLAVSTLGVTWLLLVLSMPPDGGGLGWGGRLGVVALGLAVPLVADAVFTARVGRGQAVVMATAVALSLVVTISGARKLEVSHDTSLVVETEVSAALAPFIDTDEMLISTDRRLGRIAPEMAMLVPLQSLPDDGPLADVLASAAAVGVDRVVHLDLFDNDLPSIPEGWIASDPDLDGLVRTITIERVQR